MRLPSRARRLSLATLPLLLAIALGSCRDSTGAAPEVVAQVIITPATRDLVVGEAVALSTILRNAEGRSVSGHTVSWSSADPGTATVAHGRVTGVAVGSTEITARVGDALGRAVVTVAAAPVASVAVEPRSLELQPHDVVPLTVVMVDRNGQVVADRPYRTIISDSRVATISDGRLYALNPGTATVAIGADDVWTQLVVTVHTPPRAAPRLMQRQLILEAGATGFLRAPAAAMLGHQMGRPVVSSSSDPGVVLVRNWAYEAVAPGRAEIAVAYDGEEWHIPVAVVPPLPSEFDVTVRWVDAPNAAVSASLEKAIARWGRVVVGDLPSARVTLPANACIEGAPALDEEVVHLLVRVRVVPMDGPDGVLAAAGPCVIRGASGLPAAGVVLIDEADVSTSPFGAFLLDRLVLHEIGHVLGLGTLWAESIRYPFGTDPRFGGAHARTAAGDLGFVDDETQGIAVENGGGPGTAGAHWRESVFRQELMTGWLELMVGAPLTRVTIGALADLGYTVNEGAAESLLGPGPILSTPPGGPSPRLQDAAADVVFLRDTQLPVRFVVEPGGATRPSPP